MAVKSSGQLSLRYDILAEVGGASYVNLSLRNMSSRAGFRTPDAMSEFYGFQLIRVFPFNTGYNRSNPDIACRNVILDRITRVTTNDPGWESSTMLWNDINGTNPAPFGYYAEQNSQIVRYWNGAASFYTTQGCRI